jgi:cysteine desulfurase
MEGFPKVVGYVLNEVDVMKKLYLDYAATTPVDPRVLVAMKPYFSKEFGNASSLYSMGQQARLAMENSRKRIAKIINAEPEEIVFTSGGTESDNLALVGVALSNKKRGNHIITSKIEHKAVMGTCEFLEKQGFQITYLDVDKYGIIDLEQLKKSIKKETILVSVMHANNEIGTLEPVEEVGKICREKDIYFHTDAVQSFCKIPIDVKKMKIDLLSASSHKIYGPKGVGLLYVRGGVKMEPLLHGGGHESGKRSGTENVAGIVGFAKACEIANKEMTKEAKRLSRMRSKLVKGLLKIPNSYINGHPEKRLPGNINFRFDFIEGEALILKLDMLGIEASTGSACSSRDLKSSHVLISIGLSPKQAHGSLRITMGRYTKEKDIDYVLKNVPKVVGELRGISPFKGKW